MASRTVLSLSSAQQDFAARFLLFDVVDKGNTVTIRSYQYPHKLCVHKVNVQGHCTDLKIAPYTKGDLEKRQSLANRIGYGTADAALDAELLAAHFAL